MLKPGLTRFVLALFVIMFHLSRSIFLGEFAVFSFFILSGYWISVMYEKKYLLKENTLKVFYVSRFWRILPVFYAVTIFAILINFLCHIPVIGEVQKLGFGQKCLLYFSNVFLFGYNFLRYRILVPAWSLDIEMQFYLIFPFLYFLTRKSVTRLTLVLGITVVSYGALLVLFEGHYHNKTLLSYLFLFIAGMYSYQTKVKFNNLVQYSSLLLFLIIVAVNMVVPSMRNLSRDSNTQYYHILSLVLTIAAYPMVINSVHKPSDNKDRILGDLSFLVYLIHAVWLIVYELLIGLNYTKYTTIPLIAGFIAVTVITSYILYKLVDRPSELARQKWVKGQL